MGRKGSRATEPDDRADRAFLVAFAGGLATSRTQSPDTLLSAEKQMAGTSPAIATSFACGSIQRLDLDDRGAVIVADP
jgi:hypothetical protein